MKKVIEKKMGFEWFKIMSGELNNRVLKLQGKQHSIQILNSKEYLMHAVNMHTVCFSSNIFLEKQAFYKAVYVL